MSLFTELKRRNVLRVAAAYVAVSWLLIQVVETLFPVFGLSDAAIRTVVIVLAIGFVPAVVVAWAFELTPEGFVRDSEVDRTSPSVKARAKRLDRIVMVALALAVGYFAFDKFMLDPARDEAIAATAREQGRAEGVQARRESGPPLVAVLPFSAVTANEDSEFFAAGVHDDLLTQLAQTPSLLVISRTSVMEYKDVQRNIREIGAALGADAILEGGVQTAGDRIRINAQLIDAKTDEHLWAETYDRELTAASIFDVQDDIAHAIAEALQTTFTAAARNAIPTENMAAYRAYHEALAISDSVHGGMTSDEYRELLRTAADLDPSFTRPLVLLVNSYALTAFTYDDAELIPTVDQLVEEIRAAAPGSVDHLIAQTSYTYYILKDYDLALDLVMRVLELVPSDTDAIDMKSWIERRQGDFDAVVDTLRQARKLQPRNPYFVQRMFTNLVLIHRYDEALAEIEGIDEPAAGIAFIRALIDVREHGDLQRMAQDVAAIHEKFDNPESLDNLFFAYVMAGQFDAAASALEDFPDGDVTPMGLSNKQFNDLLASYFLGKSDRIAELVALARSNLDESGTDCGEVDDWRAITLAALAAVEGDTEGATRFIQQYYRGAGTDWAHRAMNRDFTCQILGIAGAADAAVQCIRDGLTEPSRIMPFLEPYLPFYDGIRDEPGFVELIEELG